MSEWNEMNFMQKDAFIIRKLDLTQRILDFAPTSDLNDAWYLFDFIKGQRIEIKNNGSSINCYIDTGITSAEDNAFAVPEAISKTVLKIAGIKIK